MLVLVRLHGPGATFVPLIFVGNHGVTRTRPGCATRGLGHSVAVR